MTNSACETQNSEHHENVSIVSIPQIMRRSEIIYYRKRIRLEGKTTQRLFAVGEAIDKEIDNILRKALWRRYVRLLKKINEDADKIKEKYYKQKAKKIQHDRL